MQTPVEKTVTNSVAKEDHSDKSVYFQSKVSVPKSMSAEITHENEKNSDSVITKAESF